MIEVLKQARKALIQARKLRFALWRHGCDCRDEHTCDPLQDEYAKQFNDSIIKLEQAIAELESQEPVAYIRRNEYNEYRLEPTDNFKIEDIPVSVEVMLYTHPPQRKPLTDEQATRLIQEVVSTSNRPIGAVEYGLLVFREAEVAHGIKD